MKNGFHDKRCYNRRGPPSKGVLPRLVCTACKNELVLQEEQSTILCSSCGQQHPVQSGAPIMMEPTTWAAPGKRVDRKGAREFRAKSALRRIAEATAPPSPSLNVSRIVQLMLEDLGCEASVLDLGSGGHRLAHHVINVDIALSPNVDIVAAGQALPFKDATFDAVITQAVLEHVPDPGNVVAEIGRVLKDDGYIYAEIPFMQGYHADPGDYHRFTRSGIRWLFRDFEATDLGVCVGPSSALAWMLREYARLVVYGSEPLGKIMYRLVGWITLPLKYLDLIMARTEKAHVIAAGFYFYGRRRA